MLRVCTDDPFFTFCFRLNVHILESDRLKICAADFIFPFAFVLVFMFWRVTEFRVSTGGLSSFPLIS